MLSAKRGKSKLKLSLVNSLPSVGVQKYQHLIKLSLARHHEGMRFTSLLKYVKKLALQKNMELKINHSMIYKAMQLLVESGQVDAKPELFGGSKKSHHFVNRYHLTATALTIDKNSSAEVYFLE